MNPIYPPHEKTQNRPIIHSSHQNSNTSHYSLASSISFHLLSRAFNFPPLLHSFTHNPLCQHISIQLRIKQTPPRQLIPSPSVVAVPSPYQHNILSQIINTNSSYGFSLIAASSLSHTLSLFITSCLYPC